MTDEVELEHQGISVPAEHTTETPPHHPHKAQKIHHDRECELECPGVDQEQYIITKDSSGTLVSDYQFYEPEVPGVGTRTGFVYKHNKTHGFDYVNLAPLKAGLNSSGRKSSNSGVQTDPQQDKQELITFNEQRAPEKSQQTSELLLANTVTDNMTYIQGRRYTHDNEIEKETETVRLLGPSRQNGSPTYKNAPARGFLVPYPHDRRQRNLAGQEINFLSMRAMHECDSGLEWEEESRSEVRPSRQQLYAESSPIRERVVITYVRDAAVSCYSEQDYIGNNVFVILSDSVSGDSKFGDYVIGTVPTMQPEKFYSDRLDDETKVALLQAQQDHDNRLSTENKDVAAWWNNQEPRSVSAFLAARGKEEKEAVPDEYTESVTNLSDYYETEDEIFYGAVAKRKVKNPLRKARLHMHKHEIHSGLNTELRWNEMVGIYDQESPARKAGLNTAMESAHQREPASSLLPNTLTPSSKEIRRHSDMPRRPGSKLSGSKYSQS